VYDILECSPVTAFAGIQGIKYDGSLMIVGRSVNGWTNSWSPSEMEDKKASESILSNAYKDGNTGCPLIWVSELWANHDPNIAGKYNTKKSAFFRTVRAVTGELGVADINCNDWPSYIVWTNLYKIAPDKIGNPSSALMKIQREIAGKIFVEEICQWRPKRILFLTGIDWVEPFLSLLDYTSDPYKLDGLACLSGKLLIPNSDLISDFVVMPHPQGKPGPLILSSVVNTFKQLGD